MLMLMLLLMQVAEIAEIAEIAHLFLFSRSNLPAPLFLELPKILIFSASLRLIIVGQVGS